MSTPAATGAAVAPPPLLSALQAAVVLALLLGLQPVITDLYLPTLPLIVREFAAPLSAVQMTMSALILAFGLIIGASFAVYFYNMMKSREISAPMGELARA